MSKETFKDELEKLKNENARLLAALEDAEYECERLEIINSNLERQLGEANRELEKNIEILQGFKSDIEGLVSSFEKVKDK